VVKKPSWKIWVNGKDHPIYEMENHPFMFETTNQARWLGDIWDIWDTPIVGNLHLEYDVGLECIGWNPQAVISNVLEWTLEWVSPIHGLVILKIDGKNGNNSWYLGLWIITFMLNLFSISIHGLFIIYDETHIHLVGVWAVFKTLSFNKVLLGW
jgi:hypothetical protein